MDERKVSKKERDEYCENPYKYEQKAFIYFVANVDLFNDFSRGQQFYDDLIRKLNNDISDRSNGLSSIQMWIDYYFGGIIKEKRYLKDNINCPDYIFSNEISLDEKLNLFLDDLTNYKIGINNRKEEWDLFSRIVLKAKLYKLHLGIVNILLPIYFILMFLIYCFINLNLDNIIEYWFIATALILTYKCLGFNEKINKKIRSNRKYLLNEDGYINAMRNRKGDFGTINLIDIISTRELNTLYKINEIYKSILYEEITWEKRIDIANIVFDIFTTFAMIAWSYFFVESGRLLILNQNLFIGQKILFVLILLVYFIFCLMVGFSTY